MRPHTAEQLLAICKEGSKGNPCSSELDHLGLYRWSEGTKRTVTCHQCEKSKRYEASAHNYSLTPNTHIPPIHLLCSSLSNEGKKGLNVQHGTESYLFPFWNRKGHSAYAHIDVKHQRNVNQNAILKHILNSLFVAKILTHSELSAIEGSSHPLCWRLTRYTTHREPNTPAGHWQ